MMRAAYKYYQQTTSAQTAPSKVMLGELNSGNTAKIRIQPRSPRRQKPEVTLTAEEAALINLYDTGRWGAYVAHYAPRDL